MKEALRIDIYIYTIRSDPMDVLSGLYPRHPNLEPPITRTKIASTSTHIVDTPAGIASKTAELLAIERLRSKILQNGTKTLGEEAYLRGVASKRMEVGEAPLEHIRLLLIASHNSLIPVLPRMSDLQRERNISIYTRAN